jgi:hypothetical protein
VIRLAPDLWRKTIAALRSCGGRRRECVSYWIGPVDDPTRVDEVIHPKHHATAGSYELDDGWLHQFWVSLHRQQKAVRVQVHTHAFEAFHSHTDDQWPIVHTPGFFSLVVPSFATRFRTSELFLAEIDATGEWQERHVSDVLHGIPEEGADR